MCSLEHGVGAPADQLSQVLLQSENTSDIDNDNDKVGVTNTTISTQRTTSSGWHVDSQKGKGRPSVVYLYMLCYNMVFIMGWTLVACKLFYLFSVHGFTHGSSLAFRDAGLIVVYMQWLVWMDIVHIIIGVVPPSTINPLLLVHCKVLRRFHILIIALAFVSEVQNHWAVALLFVQWGLLDLIRYPFYVLNMLNRCPSFLKWLRYSEFIVLYPLSFVSEMYLWWLMLPYIYEKQLHSWAGLRNLFPILSHYYFYCLLLYLLWRLISFPYNYRRMLRLRLRKKATAAPVPEMTKKRN